MKINLVYDSSAAAAPAGFEPAVAAAAQYLDTLITNNITVTINVGWGEFNGEPLTGSESLGGPESSILVSYSQLKSDLAANPASPADEIALANLPAANPTNATDFVLYPAQQQALGLLPADNTAVEGTVGFSNSDSYYNFNPNDRSDPNGVDFIGIAEHELTHALGRISQEQSGSQYASVQDLFRYASPGTLATAATEAPYFSINGGTTNLGTYDMTADWADWASSNGPDSFDEYAPFGVENPITPVDIVELNVLGFSVTTNLGSADSFSANNETALNAAISEVIYGASNTNYTITLAPGLPAASLALNTALFAVSVPSGGTLTINGDGQTIDGGGQFGALQVSSGDVILDDLTIADTVAMGGAGGAGSGGGGGGAGEGGGLFIGSGATVTLNGVSFSGDTASGGSGGAAQLLEYGGDGGGFNGGAPILNGASLETESGGQPGGAGQGGGGGGAYNLNPKGGSGGAGGWGGGGGGGGSGGFSDISSTPPGGTPKGGTGGFGGGAGAATTFAADSSGFGGGGGGGGLGAGGDVFVSNGGALVIGDGVLSGGTVVGGSGGAGYSGDSGFGAGAGGTTGLALGAGIFIQGNGTEVLDPGAGQTVTVDEPIADQTGSGGTGVNAGAGTLVAENAGTVVLNAQDTYSGGTTLEAGVMLGLGIAGAAGGGAIDFAGPATLTIGSGVSVANAITGFGPGDTIAFNGMTVTGSTYAGGVLTLTGSPGGATIDLSGSFAASRLAVTNVAGGADVTIAPRVFSWTGGGASTAFDLAANWDDITDSLNPAQTAPGTADTALFNSSGGAISGTGTVATLEVGSAGAGVLELSAGATVVTGFLVAGVTGGAVGQIGLTGAGTELSVTGSATVGDAGTGVLSVLDGATFAAATLTIGSFGSGPGAVVVSGGVIDLSGALNVGTALGTGELTVGPGASVQASVVSVLGQVVLEGGLLDPTVSLINQGQTAGGYGTIAAGDIIDEGAIQVGGKTPSRQLLVVQGTLLGGGTLTVDGAVRGSNPAGVLQINAGGTLELTGAVLSAATTTFTDNLTPAGTYTVNNSVVDVAFADATGVLELDDIAGFAGTIATVQAGDAFVIAGGTLSGLGVSNNDTLTVHDSGSGAGAGGIDQLVFAAPVTASGFTIVNGDTVQVACFAAGSRIGTPAGPVAVEALRPGDRLITADGGGCEAIVWIGSRLVDCAHHLYPATVWPVRVRAGAFGIGRPTRDLYLSPDHAIFVNNVLVPVKLLINGTSISQVKRDRVRYFHVELSRHAVILAEGLTVESYLETGGRANFLSGHPVRLFPDFNSALRPAAAWAWETRGAAPLSMTGPSLEAARRMVIEDAPGVASRFNTPRPRHRIPA